MQGGSARVLAKALVRVNEICVILALMRRALAIALLGLFIVRLAEAQDSIASNASDLAAPPAPDSLEPTLAAGVSSRVIVPMSDNALCPAESECVLGQGFSVGLSLERRWPSGPSIGFRYDAWFMDSSTVYELGVLQALQAFGRFAFTGDDAMRPYIFGGLGGIAFGDSFSVATVGLIGEIGLGAELELGPTTSLTCSVPVSFIVASAFETSVDEVRRGGQGVDVVIALQLGVRFSQIPSTQ